MDPVPTAEDLTLTTTNLETMNIRQVGQIINNPEYHYHIPGTNVQGKPDIKPRSSFLNIQNPLEVFAERSIYREIERNQRTERKSVLHLYGMPGSGKTEIVRKLAEEFPYSADCKLMVKHEIDCSEKNEDVVESLKLLSKEMLNHNLITNAADCNSACSSLEKNRTSAYIQLLCDARVPIVIVIQDPPETYQKLLTDFASSVKKADCSEHIHVYITSNFKDTLLELSATKIHEITGLTEEEGLNMLLGNDSRVENDAGNLEGEHEEVDPGERQAATEIVQALTGSPLGLAAVKRLCETTYITYKDYLILSFDPNDPLSFEDLDTFGPELKPIFEAVIRLLRTKEGLLEIMKTLVIFHHGAMPRRLVDKIMQGRREKEDEDPFKWNARNKKKSGEIIHKMMNLGNCKIEWSGKDLKSVAFHQVIFSAVQAHLKSEEYQQHLKEAILAISSVVNKDLRKEDDLKFMKNMLPHIKAVLAHAETHGIRRALQSNGSQATDADQFLVNMALVHLREVCGAIFTTINKKSAEESLKRSVKMIWEEVTERSETNVNLDVFLNKQKKSVEQYATEIVKACKDAGEDLERSGFVIARYISLVLQIKEEDVKFVSSLSNNESLMEYLKKSSEFSLRLPSEIIKKLRADPQNIFLDENKHYPAFFVDRLVSVIYSLSRVILYDNNDDVTTERREQFSWISDLAHTLCVECRKVTKVNLLCLWLNATSKIAVRFKGVANLDESHKKEILLEARSLAEQTLEQVKQGDDEVFENGLQKSMINNVFQELTCLRTLVRIDAKLWCLYTSSEREKLLQSTGRYWEELHAKASSRMDTWKQSPSCIVYCGKYLAAKGQFEQAAQLFLQVANLKVVKRETVQFFGWVCFNYARSVCAGNLQEYKQDASEKCKEALEFQQNIKADLLKKLNDQIFEMDSLDSTI